MIRSYVVTLKSKERVSETSVLTPFAVTVSTSGFLHGESLRALLTKVGDLLVDDFGSEAVCRDLGIVDAESIVDAIEDKMEIEVLPWVVDFGGA